MISDLRSGVRRWILLRAVSEQRLSRSPPMKVWRYPRDILQVPLIDWHPQRMVSRFCQLSMGEMSQFSRFTDDGHEERSIYPGQGTHIGNPQKIDRGNPDQCGTKFKPTFGGSPLPDVGHQSDKLQSFWRPLLASVNDCIGERQRSSRPVPRLEV